ncbi:MAG: DUF3343 domain-containing protein [Lachnospiraceae bacterium]|nr:DUF3343 domain-containing protein [Lachnospiraceae bacterium]MDY5741938.1 DUF3343 domain-containing protein [Lachnospiraceae bacterium]
MSEGMNYYILFRNYEHGLALHDILKAAGLQARIAPTPQSVRGTLGCGMSLLVTEEHITAVRACIAKYQAVHESIVAMPCRINPQRHRYC